MAYRPYDKITTGGVSDQRTNNTGQTLVQATPVRINTAGTLDTIDVSNDNSRSIVGVVATSISDGATGEIIGSGKITNVSVPGTFGDTVYVSKAGALTNIPPTEGQDSFVSGDFVIAVGVIAKNIDNPLQKDLILNIEVHGIL